MVHTGQHFDKEMSDVFFNEMDIPYPNYNLNINSLGHGAMTGRMLEGIETLLMKEKPDVLLVYGDTNSTLAGALAARKLNIKVAHVEAGLRSFNMKMPEEINRILTDRISDVLFCPTDTAVQNLKAEGFEKFDAKIVRSGDVMQDAALYYAERSAEMSTLKPTVFQGDFVLATIHRAENTDHPDHLRTLVSTLNAIHEHTRVVFPLHPRTKKMLTHHGLNLKVECIKPVGYFDMIELLKHCSLVMTDSGGVQKEAFFFRKPCITLREETEWTELVDHGFNEVVGTNQQHILEAFERAKSKQLDYSIDLYGDGKSAEVICSHLMSMN